MFGAGRKASSSLNLGANLVPKSTSVAVGPAEEGEPIQLVYIDVSTEELRVNQDALNLLRKNFRAPLHVLGITGLGRCGKSTFLNLFRQFHAHGLPSGSRRDSAAAAKSGRNRFRTSNSSEACTEGIWMWSQPLPSAAGAGSVLLLDAEGTNVARKQHLVAKLTALVLLLSSVAVLNTFRVFSQHELNDLGAMLSLARVVADQGTLARSIIPHLTILIRDHLPLSIRGVPANRQEYLEHVFRSSHEDNFDGVRQDIRSMFPSISLSLLERPADPEATSLEKALRDVLSIGSAAAIATNNAAATSTSSPAPSPRGNSTDVSTPTPAVPLLQQSFIQCFQELTGQLAERPKMVFEKLVNGVEYVDFLIGCVNMLNAESIDIQPVAQRIEVQRAEKQEEICVDAYRGAVNQACRLLAPLFYSDDSDGADGEFDVFQLRPKMLHLFDLSDLRKLRDGFVRCDESAREKALSLLGAGCGLPGVVLANVRQNVELSIRKLSDGVSMTLDTAIAQREVLQLQLEKELFVQSQMAYVEFMCQACEASLPGPYKRDILGLDRFAMETLSYGQLEKLKTDFLFSRNKARQQTLQLIHETSTAMLSVDLQIKLRESVEDWINSKEDRFLAQLDVVFQEKLAIRRKSNSERWMMFGVFVVGLSFVTGFRLAGAFRSFRR